MHYFASIPNSPGVKAVAVIREVVAIVEGPIVVVVDGRIHRIDKVGCKSKDGEYRGASRHGKWPNLFAVLPLYELHQAIGYIHTTRCAHVGNQTS